MRNLRTLSLLVLVALIATGCDSTRFGGSAPQYTFDLFPTVRVTIVNNLNTCLDFTKDDGGNAIGLHRLTPGEALTAKISFISDGNSQNSVLILARVVDCGSNRYLGTVSAQIVTPTYGSVATSWTIDGYRPLQPIQPVGYGGGVSGGGRNCIAGFFCRG